MSKMPNPRSTAPRWMRITLVVSLALNLLIAGLVLGAVIRGPGGNDSPRLAREMAGLPFVMALEPQDRRSVFWELRKETGPFRKNRAETRRRLGALLQALRAEEFDRGRVETLLGEQRGAAVARQNAGERMIIDRIGAMSTAERRAYADRLEQALRRRPKR